MATGVSETITGDLDVDNDLNVGGDATIDEHLKVRKDVKISGQLRVGSLIVDGNGVVGGDLTVGGSESSGSGGSGGNVGGCVWELTEEDDAYPLIAGETYSKTIKTKGNRSVSVTPSMLGVEGSADELPNLFSVEEGYRNKALAFGSHAEGGMIKTVDSSVGSSDSYVSYNNYAYGAASHVEGMSNVTGTAGYENSAYGEAKYLAGNAAHAEGFGNKAVARATHAEGNGVYATGLASHAEGIATVSGGTGSHTEGQGGESTDTGCHVEGGAMVLGKTLKSAVKSVSSSKSGSSYVTAVTVEDDMSGYASDISLAIEYQFCYAVLRKSGGEWETWPVTGYNSTSGAFTIEGSKSLSGYEGSVYATKINTEDLADYATRVDSGKDKAQQGVLLPYLYYSTAEGRGSHAEGLATKALGKGSHSQGIFTYTLNEGETSLGVLNESDEDMALSVGNGYYDDDNAPVRRNGLELKRRSWGDGAGESVLDIWGWLEYGGEYVKVNISRLLSNYLNTLSDISDYQ